MRECEYARQSKCECECVCVCSSSSKFAVESAQLCQSVSVLCVCQRVEQTWVVIKLKLLQHFCSLSAATAAAGQTLIIYALWRAEVDGDGDGDEDAGGDARSRKDQSRAGGHSHSHSHSHNHLCSLFPFLWPHQLLSIPLYQFRQLMNS